MLTDTSNNSESGNWWIYLIRTKQGHLYCGITTNVQNRLNTHAAGKGAKYLRGKGPLKLEWSKSIGSRSQASQYEIRIKKLSKDKKEKLIEDPTFFNDFLQ